MRARPPTPPPPLPVPLLLLLLLPPPPLASAAAAPPTLLVLRSACPLRDPSVFSERRLLAYAAESGRSEALPRPLRFLGYEETCGRRWRWAVAHSALRALGEGGGTLCAGCAGDACGALAEAARLLRQPQPPGCAADVARAAAVALLAARLRWRRALLPPARPAHAACERTLREAAGALAAAGVAVRRSALGIDSAFHPHATVVCASEYSTLTKDDIGSGVLLFMQVEEMDPSESPHDSGGADGLPVVNLNNVNVEQSPSATVPSDPQTVNLSDRTYLHGEILNTLIPFSLAAKSVIDFQEATSQLTENILSTSSPISAPLKMDDSSVYKLSNSQHLSKIRAVFRKRRNTPARAKRSVEGTRSLLMNLDEPTGSRSLLLSGPDQGSTRGPLDWRGVYREALDIAQRYARAERTRFETAQTTFCLYESIIADGAPRWNRVATLSVTSSRNLDSSADWATQVDALNATDGLERWEQRGVAASGADAESGAETAALGAAGALAAGGALALAAGGALVARAAASRRRRLRRRPRASVLLATADFAFPADEGRRVGEGMETMVSLLKHLHEFAGPEPERPDLLKQPPPPRAHSAPSSTCSVTRLAPDARVRYKGDPVHMKYLPAAALELRRKATDVLLVIQSLRHENLNPFIGCLPEARPALVWEACGRGSLEDVLVADDIRLDWTFRLSLLTDLVRGMRYLHASPLRLHGRLSSRNCVVDSRWVLRVTDHGAPAFARAQGLPRARRSARELLWTAPELLREMGAGEERGSQAGDVFSFAIIMQEVIVRGEPYCMLPLTPEEIVEKLSRPPPLIRPSVSMGAAPPDAVGVMRQCWSEPPDLRPDFNRLYDTFRHLHRGRKTNIVDSMFEMLEKYSNNLEELIKERTEQLDMEKKKTEQLLNRMLPRSVAERLMLGGRVEPEEFEEVSIYFSDIVGFTAIAARSTPVQVVDLLNDLYTTFDAAIEQYRVYKVETIGDAYMVVGGLPLRARDHAESVATMALHLLHLAGRFRVRHLPATPLHLRIGLHTGACCAAVVGLTMPRYCLFGDTVNTASRMESTGAAWRIQVSAATAERLAAAGGYRLRSRGLTQIKGKGAMHTYWLLGKDGFDKPLPTPPPLESEEVLFEADGETESEASPSPPAPGARAAGGGAGAVVERQRSDPSPTSDKFAWQRSGAISADSSPPPRAPPARYRYLRASVSTLATLADPPAPADGCEARGARVLRRQWSLERGDALAAAAAEGPREPPRADVPEPPEPPEPLALRVPPARAPLPRYRTRDDARPPPP